MNKEMQKKIHKFVQNGMYILLDVNSGAVHVVDKMIYDMMDYFDGENDAEVQKAGRLCLLLPAGNYKLKVRK